MTFGFIGPAIAGSGTCSTNSEEAKSSSAGLVKLTWWCVMVKVVAVVQARMGSTRLPGKVLMDLGGHPVLQWCVRAARAAPGIDEVWVATSKLRGDDNIE